MKLCKDCKHMRPDGWWLTPDPDFKYTYGKCAHPESVIEDGNVVIGFTTRQSYCSTSRRFEEMCGEEGKHWGPAPPLPPKRWWEFWK